MCKMVMLPNSVINDGIKQNERDQTTCKLKSHENLFYMLQVGNN